MRALAFWVRHAPDRLIHATRRARLHRRLLEQGPPRSVLFLCHGNVCRSPFAAAYFEKILETVGAADIRVRSAGFVGPDRGSPAEGLVAARKYGVNLSPHISALVTPADMESSDWVVVMSAAQVRQLRREFPRHDSQVIVLGDVDPLPISKRTILDPWNGDLAKFDESYARIVRCVDALAETLIRERRG